MGISKAYDVDREFGFCLDCGLKHAKAERLKRLRRMLPASIKEILNEYPCVYPRAKPRPGHAVCENRMLYRDLHDIGAVRVVDWTLTCRVVWTLPGGDK